MFLRLFFIVTRSENHVKIAGFLTTIQTPIFQKKFTKNALGNSSLPQGTIVSIYLFYCCAASLTTPCMDIIGWTYSPGGNLVRRERRRMRKFARGRYSTTNSDLICS